LCIIRRQPLRHPARAEDQEKYMKQTKFKGHRKIWSKWAGLWEKFVEPGRPSRDDIRNYHKLLTGVLKGKKNTEVLLLGSTPEIRDLLYKFSILQEISVTCVDMTKDMYEAMGELMYNKNKKEEFVLGNWVDMKFNQKFDVIIGDYVNGNIGTEYRNRYYTNLQSLLKKNGCFITKDAVITADCKIKSVELLFMELLSQTKNEELTIKQAANYIGMRLLWASWFKNNKQDNRASLKFFWSEILSLGRELKGAEAKGDRLLMKAIYLKFFDAWRPFKDKYWTFHLEKDNAEMLGRYFKIEETLYSKDYGKILGEASPIFLLKKK